MQYSFRLSTLTESQNFLLECWVRIIKSWVRLVCLMIVRIETEHYWSSAESLAYKTNCLELKVVIANRCKFCKLYRYYSPSKVFLKRYILTGLALSIHKEFHPKLLLIQNMKVSTACFLKNIF